MKNILLAIILIIRPLYVMANEYIVTQQNYKEIFCYANSSYRLNGSINLGNDTIVIPPNSIIHFDSGKLIGGVIFGNNTSFSKTNQIIFEKTQFAGSYRNSHIEYVWFDKYENDTELLRAFFDLTKKNTQPVWAELQPERIYNIYQDKLEYGHAIFEFLGRQDIHIIGNNAIINDLRPRKLVKHKSYDGVFLFSNCRNVTIEDLNYQNYNEDFDEIKDNNKTLFKSGFENQIGYVGTSFILLQNDCSQIQIKSTVIGARYGVKSGDFSKFWLCGEYGLKDSSINLNAFKTGYPVAIELGDNLTISVNSNKHHRAAYLCGISNSFITIKAKDIYIAPYHCLLSDTRYSKSKDSIIKYKPCYNIYLSIEDLGSQIATNPDSYCVGFQTYKFFENRIRPLNWHNINIEILKKAPSECLGLFSINRPFPSSISSTLRIADVFQNINIKAIDMFKSEQYAFRFSLNPYGIYKNITLDIVAPRNCAIINNQSSYRIDLSRCVINKIFDKSH